MSACTGRFCEGSGEATDYEHHCPFDVELDDGDYLCNCCDECTDGCAWEI